MLQITGKVPKNSRMSAPTLPTLPIAIMNDILFEFESTITLCT